MTRSNEIWKIIMKDTGEERERERFGIVVHLS